MTWKTVSSNGKQVPQKHMVCTIQLTCCDLHIAILTDRKIAMCPMLEVVWG